MNELERIAQEHEQALESASALLKAHSLIALGSGKYESYFMLHPSTTIDGGWQVSFFDRRGPYGHAEDEDLDKVVSRALEDHSLEEVRPLSEAEFIAVSSTPEFREGVKQVTYTGLLNSLTYEFEHAKTQDIIEAAYAAKDIDEAIEILLRGLSMLRARHTPRRNPKRSVGSEAMMRRKPAPYETTPEVFVILGRGEDDALVVQGRDGSRWQTNPAKPKKVKKRKKMTYRIELPLGAYEDLRVQVGLVRQDGSYPDVVIHSPENIYALMRPMSNVSQEVLSVICLSADNSVNGIAEIARGGITGAAIDPRVLAQYAVLTNAVSIILVHNHPSGNPTASGEDIHLTRNVEELLRLLGVTLLDHVIIGKDGYTSLSSEGML